MRVTTKGQVTIPREARLALGITAGTELDFRVLGSELVVSKRQGAGRGKEVARKLAASAGWSGMSTDDLLALTRPK